MQYDAEESTIAPLVFVGSCCSDSLVTVVPPSAQGHLLGMHPDLGDGSTRIAGIRLRLKHDTASDTLAVTDSLQISCSAIDDSSGNINRTYNKDRQALCWSWQARVTSIGAKLLGMKLRTA